MAKSVNKPETLSVGPFGVRIDAPAKSDFDKYYIEYELKDVFVRTGVDVDGDDTGIVEKKIVSKKIDIAELINSQADTVGVDAYIKSLAIQGVDINELNTVVDDTVNDFSQCPDNLADTVLIGDNAKKAFDNLDPALKGNHTTIEGFLGSLTQDTIDAYIKARVAAVMPTSDKDGE